MDENLKILREKDACMDSVCVIASFVLYLGSDKW